MGAMAAFLFGHCLARMLGGSDLMGSQQADRPTADASWMLVVSNSNQGNWVRKVCMILPEGNKPIVGPLSHAWVRWRPFLFCRCLARMLSGGDLMHAGKGRVTTESLTR
jgi:hypothetical protein